MYKAYDVTGLNEYKRSYLSIPKLMAIYAIKYIRFINIQHIKGESCVSWRKKKSKVGVSLLRASKNIPQPLIILWRYVRGSKHTNRTTYYCLPFIFWTCLYKSSRSTSISSWASVSRFVSESFSRFIIRLKRSIGLLTLWRSPFGRCSPIINFIFLRSSSSSCLEMDTSFALNP